MSDISETPSSEYDARRVNARALVPVARGADPLDASNEAALYRSRTATPSFLTQLSRQYETRFEAARRREETRQAAEESYSSRPLPASARHLVWA